MFAELNSYGFILDRFTCGISDVRIGLILLQLSVAGSSSQVVLEVKEYGELQERFTTWRRWT